MKDNTSIKNNIKVSLKTHIRKLYVIASIALLLTAWIPFTGRPTVGEPEAKPTPVTWTNIFNHQAQKGFEGVWEQKFGLRNILVRTKNTLYDWMNLGLFHMYGRTILQGKKGNLFERPYIVDHFYSNEAEVRQEISENVKSFKLLQEELKKLGIPIMVILEPNKADYLKDKWPFMWHIMRKYNPKQINYYTLYEEDLTKNGISYVNLNRKLLNDDFKKYFFTKGGTHWTTVMSARSLPFIVEEYNKLTNASYKTPEIKLVAFVNEPYHAEEDINSLLNLLKINKQNRYPYTEFLTNNSNQYIGFTLNGDSYGHQLISSFISSGLINESDVLYYENHLLSQDEVFKIVERKLPLFLNYTLLNLKGSRIKEETDNIRQGLQQVQFFKGWHGKEEKGRWSSNDASVRFITDGKKDKKLHIQIDNWLSMAKRVDIKVNGNLLKSLPISHYVKPFGLDLQISKHDLNRGVNTIQISVDGAVSPRQLSINGDSRILGIFVSHLTVV